MALAATLAEAFWSDLQTPLPLRFEQVCRELNDAYGRYASLKTRYDEIMAYWKQQKRRGYITPEEYQQLAEEFIGARSVKNKEDETNGKDP